MKMWQKILLTIIVLIVISLLVFLYSKYIGAKMFYVKEYPLYSTTIDNSYNGLKIAHLSDIHYGLGITKNDLEKIVKDVNSLKPDIIVFTGDLVNNKVTNKQYKELVTVMNKLEAKLGKYAIDGNHDYIYKNFNKLIEDCGFTNLNDTYDIIYNESYESIFIAGVSNNTYTTKKIEDKTETIFDFMNSEEYKSKYSILLMHEPDFIEDIDYKLFNIVLAGHSHAGQVRLPFIGVLYTPKYARKYYEPYYKLDNTELYISNGLGTSEIPIRLFNRPSYNFYRLYKK